MTRRAAGYQRARHVDRLGRGRAAERDRLHGPVAGRAGRSTSGAPTTTNLVRGLDSRAILAAVKRGAAVINMSYGSARCAARVPALQARSRGDRPVAAAGNEWRAATRSSSRPRCRTSDRRAVDADHPRRQFSNPTRRWTSRAGESIPSRCRRARQGADRLPAERRLHAPWTERALRPDGLGRRRLDPRHAADLTGRPGAQVVRLSARDIGAKGYDSDTGFGLLDVGAALQKRRRRATRSSPTTT